MRFITLILATLFVSAIIFEEKASALQCYVCDGQDCMEPNDEMVQTCESEITTTPPTTTVTSGSSTSTNPTTQHPEDGPSSTAISSSTTQNPEDESSSTTNSSSTTQNPEDESSSTTISSLTSQNTEGEPSSTPINSSTSQNTEGEPSSTPISSSISQNPEDGPSSTSDSSSTSQNPEGEPSSTPSSSLTSQNPEGEPSSTPVSSSTAQNPEVAPASLETDVATKAQAIQSNAVLPRFRRSLAEQASLQLIRNYRSIARFGRSEGDAYGCYILGEGATIRRGCVLIPVDKSGCEAVRDATGTNDNEKCEVCLMDKCNGSAALRLSIASILIIVIAKLFM